MPSIPRQLHKRAIRGHVANLAFDAAADGILLDFSRIGIERRGPDEIFCFPVTRGDSFRLP